MWHSVTPNIHTPLPHSLPCLQWRSAAGHRADAGPGDEQQQRQHQRHCVHRGHDGQVPPAVQHHQVLFSAARWVRGAGGGVWCLGKCFTLSDAIQLQVLRWHLRFPAHPSCLWTRAVNALLACNPHCALPAASYRLWLWYPTFDSHGARLVSYGQPAGSCHSMAKVLHSMSERCMIT